MANVTAAAAGIARRGGARSGAGRKATLQDAQPYKVTLDAKTAAKLKQLGKGNLSAGIRAAASTVVTGELRGAQDSVPNAVPESVDLPRSPCDDSAIGTLDPRNVRVGPFHGRHETSMCDSGMRSLKKDMARAERNLIPVLVRQTTNYQCVGEILEYELVYGRRRLQACLELGLPVHAVVRQMTAAEEFLTMMAEAASNWSAFEMGTSLRRALDLGLFPTQRRLAEACGLELGFVAAALAIVALPPVVLQAYSSPTTISVSAVRVLTRALERDAEYVMRQAARLAFSRRLAPAKVLATLCGNRPI